MHNNSVAPDEETRCANYPASLRRGRGTKEEGANLHEFVLALAKHPDWQGDWQECRSASEALDQEWHQQMEAAGEQAGYYRDDLHPHGHSLSYRRLCAVHMFRERAVLWLVCRYWRILEAAERELGLPPSTITLHLRSWLGGAWNDLARDLEHEVIRSAIVHPRWPLVYQEPEDLYRKAESSMRPWGPLWAFYAPPSDTSRDEYIDSVIAGIKDAWPHYMPEAPLSHRRVGQRVSGRPKGAKRDQSFSYRVQLYSFYVSHQVPPMTWAQVVTQWNKQVPDKRAELEDTLKKALWKARDCMTPDSAVPACLGDFQLEGPKAYRLTGKQSNFFHKFLPKYL